MVQNIITYYNIHKYPALIVLGNLILYALFAYALEREDFPKLLGLFAVFFFFHFKLIQFEKYNFKFLLAVGLLFRLIFLFAEPNLSQDFYRFIWDGELIKNGINPYLYTPNELIENAKLNVTPSAVEVPNSKILFEGMGSLSAKHYSNYPPVNQLIFVIATFFGMNTVMGSIISMRVIILLADVGVLYFGRKLLQKLNLSNHTVFWYFLNPLVIIELTGNLHFEGVMLFFFVWAMYLISMDKWKTAAPIYAASIMLKLVPILFLPLFVKYFRFKKSILFYTLIGLSCLALLLPFFTAEFANHYMETVKLWFSNFEFNASIYNAIKQLAVVQLEAKPWELVKTYGKIVPPMVLVASLALTFLRKNQQLNLLFVSMLCLLAFYYFMSTTVHPWYLIFLLGLGMFTDYRFVLVWSATVVLSYFAYSNADFKENLWLLAIEYSVVFAYLGYEILKKHNIKLQFRKN